MYKCLYLWTNWLNKAIINKTVFLKQNEEFFVYKYYLMKNWEKLKVANKISRNKVIYYLII